MPKTPQFITDRFGNAVRVVRVRQTDGYRLPTKSALCEVRLRDSLLLDLRRRPRHEAPLMLTVLFAAMALRYWRSHHP